MPKEELPRLDTNREIYEKLLPYCRLSAGDVWEDPLGFHRVGILDATEPGDIERLYRSGSYRPDSYHPGIGKDDSAESALQGSDTLSAAVRCAIHDPPYNIRLGASRSDALPFSSVNDYIDFSRKWIRTSLSYLADDAHFYLWTGADQKQGFQPLPELMLLLREFPSLTSRSFISLRNQRGYGTQKNWMAARQELLYYTKGAPPFFVQYTDIPKVLKGYYKTVAGERTENTERGRSETIRPGNVWIDIQQVFYRMEENVPGSYAQKPLKAIERIIEASTKEGELIADHFAHSGTTLIAAEKLGRRCYTADNDPVFAEITIRRLERFRKTGKTGWQTASPFSEIDKEQLSLFYEK